MKSLNGDRCSVTLLNIAERGQKASTRRWSRKKTLPPRSSRRNDERFETRIANLRAARGWYFHRDGKRPAVAAVSRWLLSIVERFSEDQSRSRVTLLSGEKKPIRATTCYFVDGQETKHTESWLLPEDRSLVADNELQGSVPWDRSCRSFFLSLSVSLSKAIVAIDTDRLSRMKTIQQKTCMSRD